MDGQLTAGSVRTQVLEPVLDMVAMSQREMELHMNARTAEADSLAEFLALAEAALRDIARDGQNTRALTVALQAVEAARRCQIELFALNGEEMMMQHDLARYADDTARALRAAELAGRGSGLQAKKVAHMVVGLIDCLRDPDGDHGTARRQLDELFAVVPEAGLFSSPSVAHAVGARRAPMLRAEYARWQAR